MNKGFTLKNRRRTGGMNSGMPNAPAGASGAAAHFAVRRMQVYFKMAAKNIANNKSGYLPYLLTSCFTIAVYYILNALAENKSVGQVYGGEAIQSVLAAGSGILAVFSVIFLFYTYSFLVKRRKKEFGVFNILGMEKKHISVTMLLETAYTAAGTLAAGLVTGVVFSRLFFWVLMRMMNASVDLEWELSAGALVRTALLFLAIYLASYLNTLRQIHLSNPVELLRGGQMGEREPKSKGLLALVSFLSLAAGYYLAVTTENPVSSLMIFFLAALLVIFGTYGLFAAGSIVVLKLLRKNRKYYYKTQHFISVSGMIYRMKQNAVGLANICVLSSAVLVLISTTASLYLGMNDLIRSRYPSDILMEVYMEQDGDAQNTETLLDAKAEKYGIERKDVIKYRFLSVATIYRDGRFYTKSEIDGLGGLAALDGDGIQNVIIMPAEDANGLGAEIESLGEHEAAVCSMGKGFKDDSFSVGGQEYRVAQNIETMELRLNSGNLVSGTVILAVKDYDAMLELTGLFMDTAKMPAADAGNRGSAAIQTGSGNQSSYICFCYAFNTDADEETQAAFMEDVTAELSGAEGSSQNPDWMALNGYIEGRAGAEESFYALYGSLFFIGILLGAVFLTATVLIIYYKQVTEGYEDRERFAIMQKVGMSRREVRSSIKSQVLTVFYLPLVMAGVHILFAFPLLRKIMALMNLTNTSIFMAGCALTYLVFAVIYAAIYALTARSYYKIVS